MTTKTDLENLFQQALQKNQGLTADAWQATAAFWQTVADIQSQRAATFAKFWQAVPGQAEGLGSAKSWPEFLAAFLKWQQQTWLACWHLGADTHQQRAHLWEEWQKLAQRNGIGPQAEEDTKPAKGSSYFAANPHLAPQPTPPAPQPPAKKPAPKPEIKTEAKAAPQPTPQAEAAPQHTTNGEQADNGRIRLNEPFARNSAQASTLVSSTSARRSVVASHRSRASRRPH